MNAFEQIELIRDFIGESVASHWTTRNLLQRLNMSQNKLALKLAMTPGNWLVKKDTVTVTDSSGILPSDCAKPIYMEDSNGAPINWLHGGVSYRRVTRNTNLGTLYNDHEAYILANTIEINADSYNGTVTLWYQRRVPNLHMGFADNGSGASALIFDKSTTESISGNNYGTGRGIVFTDDYYNGVSVEVYDSTSSIIDIKSTISDWTASTATAVIVGTAAENDIYGTVSVLPEEAHMLMVIEATILSLIKPGAKLDKEALQYYQTERTRLMKEFEDWISTRIIGGGMPIGSIE